MIKYLLLLSLLSPFLVCDPQAGVTYYTITGDPFFTGNIPAQADGSIKKDLAGIPAGTHTIQAVACSELWGCSTPSPFSLSSASPVSPGALRITK
jgi:hypothetical protein